jgi:hypothetical protein
MTLFERSAAVAQESIDMQNMFVAPASARRVLEFSGATPLRLRRLW